MKHNIIHAVLLFAITVGCATAPKDATEQNRWQVKQVSGSKIVFSDPALLPIETNRSDVHVVDAIALDAGAPFLIIAARSQIDPNTMELFIHRATDGAMKPGDDQTVFSYPEPGRIRVFYGDCLSDGRNAVLFYGKEDFDDSTQRWTHLYYYFVKNGNLDEARRLEADALFEVTVRRVAAGNCREIPADLPVTIK